MRPLSMTILRLFDSSKNISANWLFFVARALSMGAVSILVIMCSPLCFGSDKFAKISRFL
jgi:hypothetical protein